MTKERLTQIMTRAQARLKKNEYEISSMENENSMLRQIIYATEIESQAQLEALLTQYKMIYSKKLPYGTNK